MPLWLAVVLEQTPPDYSGPLDAIVRTLRDLTHIVWDPSALHVPSWPGGIETKPILGLPAALARMVGQLASAPPEAPHVLWPISVDPPAAVLVSLAPYEPVAQVVRVGVLVLVAVGLAWATKEVIR